MHHVVRDCKSSKGLEITFPHYARAPSCRSETVEIALISGNIRRKLFIPELWARCWNGCVPAPFMAVPEAAMNENHSFPAREDDIRPPGQLPIV